MVAVLDIVPRIRPHVNEFRLTLTTALSVTTADVTGATTMYFTPHIGNRIALYDGTNWATIASAEVSLALGTLTSGLPYDVFAYNSSGTLTLEALAWTNGTTRATALVRQDGVWSKTGALTRRYVGTFYTTSTTQTEDSAAKRFLFNADNRVRRAMSKVDTTNSWTYNTAAFREANGATTNRLQLVVGLAEDAVDVHVVGLANYSVAAAVIGSGVGVDSTTVNSAQTFGGINPAAGVGGLQPARYVGTLSVGFHFLSWLEYGAGATTTFYGTAGTSAMQTGISATIVN